MILKFERVAKIICDDLLPIYQTHIVKRLKKRYLKGKKRKGLYLSFAS